METIMPIVNHVLEFDFHKLDDTQRKYCYGFVVVFALYLAFGWAAQLICNIVAVAYPAYISIKAIESPDKRDDTKWLTYWVVFAVFTNIEYFSSIITQVIPFYWLLKCVFYIWCFAPIENNGSIFIYHKIIRPYFLKHEKSTDDIIDKVTGKAKHLIDDALKKD
ncbi:receptor expression-enhancing protein 5-like isoform X2 [Culicoides brevitarsis]|uniref:receptor expression-enhancing protein 5-like isoform X2 n=1 Tax=Culicoides brevitarsis TaxID=469753 RepID=UPI00307C5A29